MYIALWKKLEHCILRVDCVKVNCYWKGGWYTVKQTNKAFLWKGHAASMLAWQCSEASNGNLWRQVALWQLLGSAQIRWGWLSVNGGGAGRCTANEWLVELALWATIAPADMGGLCYQYMASGSQPAGAIVVLTPDKPPLLLLIWMYWHTSNM